MKKTNVTEIARRLNLSKATVSLALNDRPGVSEKTREAVFQCLRELDNPAFPEGKKQVIKILLANRERNLIKNQGMDLFSGALAIYDSEIRKMGARLEVSYVNQDNLQQISKDLQTDDVGGIILYATELQAEEFAPFGEIKKPLVVYDNDFSDRHHCICADNQGAAAMAVDALLSRGCRDLCYFGCSIDVFNFRQRRKGFQDRMTERGCFQPEHSLVTLGRPQDYRSEIIARLSGAKMPDAIITENYYLSMEVLRALHDLHISVGRDIGFVGIDELPEYFSMDDLEPAVIALDHTERARAAISLLQKEMRDPGPVKFKVYSSCRMVNEENIKR